MITKVTVFHYSTSRRYGYVVRYQSNRTVSLLEGNTKIPKTVIEFLASHDWHYSTENSMKNIPVYYVF